MSAHETIQIYYLLLNRIGRGHGASLKDLKAYLEEHDRPKSERTIARYIEQLRNEHGLEIVYDASKRSYIVKNNSDFEIDNFLNLLTLSQTSNINLGNPKKWHEIQNVIQFCKIRSN